MSASLQDVENHEAPIRVGLEEMLLNLVTAASSVEPAKTDKLFAEVVGRTKEANLLAFDELPNTAVSKMIISMLTDKVDPSRLNAKNRAYVALWTYRVALWYTFDLYYSPIIKEYPASLAAMKAVCEELKERSGSEANLNPINPFHGYKSAFDGVLKAWSPLIDKTVKIFRHSFNDAFELKEDLRAYSHIAFLIALEKCAMGIVGSCARSQYVGFHVRLKGAIRRVCNSELGKLSHAIKVPAESKNRTKMPVVVFLDEKGRE